MPTFVTLPHYMKSLCCIGHITLDTIITPGNRVEMAGGTSFYFSKAIRQMPLAYHLITALGEPEKAFADDLIQDGIAVTVYPSQHTVHFENSYPANRDHRTQRVLQQSTPFTIEQISAVQADCYHLGPLMAGDIPAAAIPALARSGRVSLDVQGYLRSLAGDKVIQVDWQDKKIILPHVYFLKANESEMEKLTGLTDVDAAAVCLHSWGVKEVIITLGSKGSVVYTDEQFYHIPAYQPLTVVDATGCGDTYMAGYLFKRLSGADPDEAGRFAAAMATMKITASAPFNGSVAQVENFLQTANTCS
jgi:sugar/nucleoside kinase (ribokinase family)